MKRDRWELIGNTRVFIPKDKTVAEILNIKKTDFYDKYLNRYCRMVEITPHNYITLDGFRSLYGEPLEEE